LFEVAQDEDESVDTGRSKEGIMRRTRRNAKIAAAIDVAAEIGLVQS
jgi:hypothetical protein